MDDEEIVLLNEQFSIYPGKTKFNVSVTNRRVVIDQTDKGSRDRNEDVILLDDVIGCHVLQDKKKNQLAGYLCIYSYPLKKKKLGSGVVRQRIPRTFTIECKRTYQDNLLLAEIWKMTIKRLVAGEKIRTKEDIENGSLAARNLLVLVNPFSGRKKAEAMYKEKVKPMFIEAEIKHSVRKTEHPGHAKEIAKQLKLEDWDGIVIVSGDGLVHEVINGLMDRPDWKQAINMPIGVVPGGSGNALAASIVYASTGLHNVASCPIMCTFEICRGAVSKLDLVAVETSDSAGFCNPATSGFGDEPKPRNIIYSFLDIVLGLIADIDIESEELRCLGGGLRVIVYAIIRILALKKYSIEVSYLPCENGNNQCCQHGTTIRNFHAEGGAGDPTDMHQSRLGTKGDSRLLLPMLCEPLPEGWITEEDDYVMVMANFLSHVAHDSLAQRQCKLNDGKIYLNLADHTVTRLGCLKAWSLLDNGLGFYDDMDPAKSSGRTVECMAIRIVPKGNSHVIALDGEALPFAPLQCSILPGVARVMSSAPH